MKKVTTKQLQKQLYEAQMQNEIMIHKMNHKLSEDIYNPYQNLVNFSDLLYNGRDLLFPVMGNNPINSNYIFLSEAQLDLVRWVARNIYEFNETAQGIVKSITNYVIKKGFNYTVVNKKGKKVSKGNRSKCQNIIEDFMIKNEWCLLEPEALKRCVVEGECFFHLTPQEDAITNIRVIEAWQLRDPKSTSYDPKEYDWSFGILVNKKDYAKHLGYFVTPNGSLTDGEEIPPKEIVFLKKNTNANVKRGLTDFFATQETLMNVQKLLRAGIVGETARSAIAYIREFQLATQGAVQSLQAANTNYLIPVPNSYNGPPSVIPAQRVTPGQQVDIPNSLTMKNPPVGNSENLAVTLQKGYERLASFFQVPSWVVSGSNDANYASSLTSESPFVRMVETQQFFYEHYFKCVMMKVLQTAVDQDQISQELFDSIGIQVQVPNVSMRNSVEITKMNDLLYDKGVISAHEFSARCEVDYEEQQDQRKEEEPLVSTLANDQKNPTNTPEAQYKQEIRKAKGYITLSASLQLALLFLRY